MYLPYLNRREAARVLCEALGDYAGRSDVLVLGLPRGGVPVAYDIADALDVPLDLMIVRKLGVPGQEELAMGAIATGGARVLYPPTTLGLHVPEPVIEQVAKREMQELERRQRAYRGERPAPVMADRCVILVDDGLATGSTMRAAVGAVRQHGPAELVVAVPVAPPETAAALCREVDRLLCPATPMPFVAVGHWYQDFPQISDEQVCDLLHEAWSRYARRCGRPSN